jgi:hypothetical protein
MWCTEDDQEMTCLQLYQELQKKVEADVFQAGKVLLALHHGKKNQFTQPNKQCRNGGYTSRDHDKKSSCYCLQIHYGAVDLVVSNDHTTSYSESQKKMRHSFIFRASFSNSYISYHKTVAKFPLQD